MIDDKTKALIESARQRFDGALRELAGIEDPKEMRFSVEWSDDDNEYVGVCDGFPSLSHMDPDKDKALAGIRDLVDFVLREDPLLWIVSTEDTCAGVPRIRGTRIPIDSVVSRLEGGDSLEDMANDWDVRIEALHAAIAYAALEDAADNAAADAAHAESKASGEPNVSFEDMKKMLGIEDEEV